MVVVVVVVYSSTDKLSLLYGQVQQNTDVSLSPHGSSSENGLKLPGTSS